MSVSSSTTNVNGGVTLPAANSTVPSSSSPSLTNRGASDTDEIDPVTCEQQQHIPNETENVVSGSISGSRETTPDKRQQMNMKVVEGAGAAEVSVAAEERDENNKQPVGGQQNVDHVTQAADAVKSQTPMDSNNNSRDLKGHVEAESPEDEDRSPATVSNKRAVGQAEDKTTPPPTTTRKPLLGGEGATGKIMDDHEEQEKGEEMETRTLGRNDKAVQCDKESAMMLQEWTEMPRYLQFNPYVLTGYRPLQNVSECLHSLFYFHNETFNILTHGIPIVYILATVPSKLMWDDYRFLSWCHILGSVAPWCGSFLYHLFMNVNRGETVYYTLLKLDMLGIWISQSFGALPMVTATVHCLNWPLKWLFIVMYSLLSIWGLYKAMCATSPWQRRLCFFLPFTMRVLLTMIRLTRFGGGNTTSMTHIFLQDAVSVAGGAIGAMHIPEKWFPGCMDYYLNSHNIMHVLVVLAVYSMHQATVQDLDWMSKAECLVGTTISLQEASSHADL